MAARILRVLFEVGVNSNECRFQIPLHILDLLRLDHDGDVGLVIRDGAGRLLYGGTHPMRSKGEVYGKDMDQSITPSQTIFVETSRP
jgi:hypothetical protein